MPVLCRVADSLPEELIDLRAVRRHRAACLRCQAEAVRMRGLRRDLASLYTETLAAPPGFHAAVMAHLGRGAVAPRAATVRRRVGATAGAVAAAAAVAGALTLRRLRSAS